MQIFIVTLNVIQLYVLYSVLLIIDIDGSGNQLWLYDIKYAKSATPGISFIYGKFQFTSAQLVAQAREERNEKKEAPEYGAKTERWRAGEREMAYLLHPGGIARETAICK